ncbi:von Willebrand factor type A domain-containing protein [Bifidobacterium margollesii]|uniref:von Willebrand factor type A domain-containing protein n=1 Tax=Bifidobacterium margollesii TaxID=2020964 RepID=A0A2N5JAZ2_9BIFI|nr:vWA domain-containing protein [Bifidobacterium margollesii]PLS31377.1 von Willebrand factor type A domain-containing protein [Bifidobacterium margollesii]
MKRLRSVFAGILSAMLTVAMIVGFGASSAVAAGGTITAASQSTHNAIVLVLDNSGSMYGEPIERLKTATKQFVDKILSKDPQSQISLIAFSDDATVQDFTNDKNTLDNFADKNLFADSGTNVTAGLQKADEVLKNFKDTASTKYARSIVTMSDGWPNDSTSSTDQAKSMFADYNMYSVGFYPYQDNSASTFMKSIQNKGYFEANDLDALIQKFIEIVNVILNPLTIELSTKKWQQTYPTKETFYEITAKITNPNNNAVSDVTASLSTDKNLAITGNSKKTIGTIDAKKYRVVTWDKVVPQVEGSAGVSAVFEVTAEGHNMASISKQGKIILQQGVKNNELDFSKDTWAFENYVEPRGYALTDSDREALLHGLDSTSTEEVLANLSTDSGGKNDKSSGGSCFGFAVTSVLAKMNVASPVSRQQGAKSVHDMKEGKTGGSVHSYINYYWFTQLLDPVKSEEQKFLDKSNTTDGQKQQVAEIKRKVQQVKTGGAPVVLGFGVEYSDPAKGGAHAVVADKYETLKNRVIDGHTFNGRVHIYDNNHPDQQDIYLYINDQTGDWKYNVPGTTRDLEKDANSFGVKPGSDFSIWDKITGAHRGYLVFASNNTSTWLDKDIDTEHANVKAEFIAGWRTLAAYAALHRGAQSWEIEKILRGQYSDIPSYRPSTDKASRSDAHFVLPDKQSSYTVTGNGYYDYSLDYVDSLVSVKSDRAASATFSKDGDASLTGSKGSYELSSTLDSKKKLFTYTVSGKDSSNVSLDRTTAGYVVSGDNLANAKITANDADTTKSVALNTTAKKVLVTDDGSNVKAAVDKDNNGSYETVIASSDGNQNGNGGTNGGGVTPVAPNGDNGSHSTAANGSNGSAVANAGTETGDNAKANASDNADGNAKRLSSTGVAIVTIGAVAGVLLVAGVVIFIARRRRAD